MGAIISLPLGMGSHITGPVPPGDEETASTIHWLGRPSSLAWFAIGFLSKTRNLAHGDTTARNNLIIKLCPDSTEGLNNEHPMKEVEQSSIASARLPSGAVKILINGHHAGTGSLIGDRVVLTAAHVIRRVFESVRDHGVSSARVTVVGGQGENAEFRSGDMCTIPMEYFQFGGQRHDLGFISLADAFMHVRPIPYVQTPLSAGEVEATVLGFPGHSYKLHESSSTVIFNLNATHGLVEHKSSTLYGHSGGPVLNARNQIIAVHRGRHPSGNPVNQAVAINHYRNDLEVFSDILAWLRDTKRYDQLRGCECPNFALQDGRVIVSQAKGLPKVLPPVLQWRYNDH